MCLKKVFHKMWLESKIKKATPMVNKENFHFVTVSYHSKYSILAHFPFVKDNQIVVFYSPDTTKDKTKLDSHKGNYFLLVSGNRWEKNDLRAIIALDSLFTDGRIQDKKVIVTGLDTPSFNYTIKNSKRFDFVGYVDDEKLNNLYAGCYALIYPSLNEGFGYPPIEAMRYGKPVLASPFTSIAEVCSDGAIFFNPFDIYEIKSRILLLENMSMYTWLSGRAIARYNEVSNKQHKDLDTLIDYIMK